MKCKLKERGMRNNRKIIWVCVLYVMGGCN